MKSNFVITAVFVLLASASTSALAQTRPGTAGPTPTRPAVTQPAPAANAPVPNTKIGLVDTRMFGEEKGGIARYLNAVRTIEREFQPKTAELNTLQGRIKTIADEINKLSGNTVVSPQTIQTKREEGERLQRELKYKKEQADADFSKRYGELVGPVQAAIGKGLDQYALQHGLTMILDISKLEPAVLSVNPSMDITRAFIAEYNSKNP